MSLISLLPRECRYKRCTKDNIGVSKYQEPTHPHSCLEMCWTHAGKHEEPIKHGEHIDQWTNCSLQDYMQHFEDAASNRVHTNIHTHIYFFVVYVVVIIMSVFAKQATRLFYCLIFLQKIIDWQFEVCTPNH